tara:strand:- start:72 stop:512 length:441 start_codon:yes stop_codon:yes gene_type:complete
MKRLLLPLQAALTLTTCVSAETIPKISDYEFEYIRGEKIEFKCPRERKRDRETNQMKVTKLYKNCWFQLNDDHINIMDLQKINRKDIVSYYDFNNPVNKHTHFILYKDKNSQLKKLRIKSSYNPWSTEWKEHNKDKGKILDWLNSR